MPPETMSYPNQRDSRAGYWYVGGMPPQVPYQGGPVPAYPSGYAVTSPYVAEPPSWGQVSARSHHQGMRQNPPAIPHNKPSSSTWRVSHCPPPGLFTHQSYNNSETTSWQSYPRNNTMSRVESLPDVVPAGREEIPGPGRTNPSSSPTMFRGNPTPPPTPPEISCANILPGPARENSVKVGSSHQEMPPYDRELGNREFEKHVSSSSGSSESRSSIPQVDLAQVKLSTPILRAIIAASQSESEEQTEEVSSSESAKVGGFKVPRTSSRGKCISSLLKTPPSGFSDIHPDHETIGEVGSSNQKMPQQCDRELGNGDFEKHSSSSGSSKSRSSTPSSALDLSRLKSSTPMLRAIIAATRSESEELTEEASSSESAKVDGFKAPRTFWRGKKCISSLFKKPPSGFPDIHLDHEAHCFLCSTSPSGSCLYEHMFFGNLKCKDCGLIVRTCEQFKTLKNNKDICASSRKSHRLNEWADCPVEFLSDSVRHQLPSSGHTSPSTSDVTKALATYLKSLSPLKFYKPWKSAYVKCRRHSNILPSVPLDESSVNGGEEKEGNKQISNSNDRCDTERVQKSSVKECDVNHTLNPYEVQYESIGKKINKDVASEPESLKSEGTNLDNSRAVHDMHETPVHPTSEKHTIPKSESYYVTYKFPTQPAPEECPVCYFVLCPTMFTLNTVTFTVSVECPECSLWIYVVPDGQKRKQSIRKSKGTTTTSREKGGKRKKVDQ